MVGNIIHRKTDNTIIKKDKQWLATSYTDTIRDQKNKDKNTYNGDKIIDRKTDNKILNQSIPISEKSTSKHYY